MIDGDLYTDALRLPRDFGGQEHILGEIIGATHPYRSVWVPFGGDTLIDRLSFLGFEVWGDPTLEGYDAKVIPEAEVVYFGTPTIVGGKALFPSSEDWTKEKEREVVRIIVERCAGRGYYRIISGLGSGDISLEERLNDMGGGKVVAVKYFDGFTDWVIVRNL